MTFRALNDIFIYINMFLGKILIKSISAGIALYLSAVFFNITIPKLPDNIKEFLLICLTLGLINYIIRPILQFISFPLNILTLGIFGLVLNIGIIYLLDKAFTGLQIQGFWPLLYTTILILAFDSITKK